MKPVPNNPGHYDYKEFAQTVRLHVRQLTVGLPRC